MDSDKDYGRPSVFSEDHDSDWLGDGVPKFISDKDERYADKKLSKDKEHVDKGLLFPRVRREQLANPTERDEFMERVHFDLDIDTAREMLFTKDQLYFDTYNIANGKAGRYTLAEDSTTRHYMDENGVNITEITRISESNDFLPKEDWKRYEDSGERHKLHEKERNMLTRVFENNLLASINSLSQMMRSRDEGERTLGAKYSDKFRDLVEQNAFDLSGYNWHDIKSYLSDMKQPFGGQFYKQGPFFHITSPFGRGVDKIECRLYLSPQDTHEYEMVSRIIGEHYNMGVPKYYLKYGAESSRNDRIVIYTDFDHIDQELDILNNILKKHPELFNGMGKNPLWGSIDGAPEGVYFGEESKEHGHSYGSVRGKAFDDAFDRWLSSYGMRQELEDPNDERRTYHQINFHHLSDITDDMVQAFIDFFKQELSRHGIDQENPCLNE